MNILIHYMLGTSFIIIIEFRMLRISAALAILAYKVVVRGSVYNNT
jgi:hypothetical protein